MLFKKNSRIYKGFIPTFEGQHILKSQQFDTFNWYPASAMEAISASNHALVAKPTWPMKQIWFTVNHPSKKSKDIWNLEKIL